MGILEYIINVVLSILVRAVTLGYLFLKEKVDKLDNKDDTIAGVGVAVLILDILLGLPLLTVFLDGEALEKLNSLKPLEIVGLTLIDVIIWGIVLKFIFRVSPKVLFLKKKYMDKLEDIEIQLESIKYMKRDIIEDTLYEGDKTEYLRPLEESEKVLKKSYKDLQEGLYAIDILGTIKGLKKLELRDQTKEELEREIDVLNAYKKLG